MPTSYKTGIQKSNSPKNMICLMILICFIIGCVAIGFYSIRYGNSLKLLALHDS